MQEKTLTPAEKKKREEVAKAIERDNPDMPMAKKMAIATATAKRVAEVSADTADAAATERRKRMNKALDVGDINKANRESDKMKKNVGHFMRKVGQGIRNEDIERTADVKMVKYKDPETGQVKLRRMKKQVQVESVLSEGIIDNLNNIVKKKQASSIKLKDGSNIMVDMQSANLMTKVYNALNDANKKKFADAIEKNETMFMKMLDFAWKQASRR